MRWTDLEPGPRTSSLGINRGLIIHAEAQSLPRPMESDLQLHETSKSFFCSFKFEKFCSR